MFKKPLLAQKNPKNKNEKKKTKLTVYLENFKLSSLIAFFVTCMQGKGYGWEGKGVCVCLIILICSGISLNEKSKFTCIKRKKIMKLSIKVIRKIN